MAGTATSSIGRGQGVVSLSDRRDPTDGGRDRRGKSNAPPTTGGRGRNQPATLGSLAIHVTAAGTVNGMTSHGRARIVLLAEGGWL
jgi:hypothetical protein